MHGHCRSLLPQFELYESTHSHLITSVNAMIQPLNLAWVSVREGKFSHRLIVMTTPVLHITQDVLQDNIFVSDTQYL